jgi:hypothetical protein
MTGAQAFVSVNQVAISLGGTVITTPPMTPDMSGFAAGSLSSTLLDVTVTAYQNPAGGQIQFLCAKPSAGGISFFGAGKVVGQSDIDGSGPIDLAAGITAVWGAIPAGSILQITQVPIVGGVKFSGVKGNVTYVGVATPTNDDWTAHGGAGTATGTLADNPDRPGFFQIQAELAELGIWAMSAAVAASATASVTTPAGSTSVQCRWGTTITPDSTWSAWSASQTVTVTAEGTAKTKKVKIVSQ